MLKLKIWTCYFKQTSQCFVFLWHPACFCLWQKLFSYCNNQVQQRAQLYFLFNAFIGTPSTHSQKCSIYKRPLCSGWCFTHWCLGFENHPHFIFVLRPSDGPLGFLSRYVSVGPHHVLISCRVAEAHTYFHTGWKLLCANMPSFANLFSGLANLALHPRSLGLGFYCFVLCGFLARICGCDLQQWWILTGLF